MKVVYHEDCVTKEITRCYRLPDGWSESQVKDALKKYNANENKTCNAVMTEIEDGSLAAFLFESAENNPVGGRKMNYKPTINNIEKFMYCRAVENFKRGYKFRTQFELDKLIYCDIQRGQWEHTKYIYDVKRRDISSVISIMRQLLKITRNADDIHEIKYLIEVLSTDWMFNLEMNKYEEKTKNDNRTKN